MEEAVTGGSADVYTDGSTVPGINPTAGWVWVRYGTGGSTLGRRIGEGSGRLAGEQSNYKAEAWALLDALASMHQTTSANIYIDNYAVVQRWAGDKRGHTRGRSKEPARAVWSRIDVPAAGGSDKGYSYAAVGQADAGGSASGRAPTLSPPRRYRCTTSQWRKEGWE